MKHLLHFVSGHGFGHAARNSEVVRAVAALRPGLRQTVVTNAPGRFYQGIPGVVLTPPVVPMEAGVREHDPLRPDVAATVEGLRAVIARRSEHVAALARMIESLAPEAVACDVPFLVPAAARLARRPVAVVSNFTWDWIYEPFLDGLPDGGGLLDAVRGGHEGADLLLHLPFGGTAPGFRRVVEVPLVAGRSSQPAAVTLRKIGVAPDERRTRVLAAARGGLDSAAVIRAARELPGCLLLTNVDVPPAGTRAADGGAVPGNLHKLPPDGTVRYPELVAASDVVVAKLGYGIVAECIAAGTALLYPPRQMFREDELTAAALPAHVRASAMPEGDYRVGHWGPHVEGLLARPKPVLDVRTDGAEVCAEVLLSGRW